VRLLESDLFSALGDERFDLIVSNPPYIGLHEPLPPDVRQEPELALFAGEDGLAIYRRLALEATSYLAPGGTMLLELGDHSWPAAEPLFGPPWRIVAVHPDLAGTPRVLRVMLD
jgi:release factor glutamine methyltransferase